MVTNTLNYPAEMARVYYALTNQPLTTIPTGRTAAYWAELCYRYVAGFPDNIAGGKNANFWLESWFYWKTGQTHRRATGTQADWFWLSKLYAAYSGQNINGMVQPASAAFWANKLAGVPLGAAPVMEITGNGVVIANGDATPSAADHTQFVTKNAADNSDRTFTINNTGNADLTGVSVSIPTGYTVTSAPSGTIAASGSDTFTVRCNSATPGSAAGNIIIQSNELSNYVFAIACTVRTYAEKVLTLSELIHNFPLIETAGTVANDATATNADGTYNGVTLNNADAPVGATGERVGLWDGVNDDVGNFFAALNAVFNGAEGALGLWFKITSWVDGATRLLGLLQADVNNRIAIQKSATNNILTFVYTAGGVSEIINASGQSSLGWNYAMLTWSRSSGASGEMKAFINNAQQGTTQTGLGTWAGALTAARVGSNVSANFYSGNLWQWQIFNAVPSVSNRAALVVVP